MKTKGRTENIVLSAAIILGMALLFSRVATAQTAQDTEVRPTPVTVEGKQHLPLRVLTKPFSNLYAENDVSGKIVWENVRAFQPFIVYERPSEEERLAATGWYKVGSDTRGTILGWLRAEDVLEWKQTMCLAFTHPTGRERVLMFESDTALKEMSQLGQEQRVAKADELYNLIASAPEEFPDDFPVISKEPAGAIDIFKNFYLIPILDHQTVDIDGQEARILRMAAATHAAQGREEVGIGDVIAADAAGGAEDERELRNLKIDVVFVVDLTASMQPFIDSTRQALLSLVERVKADDLLSGHVKFGLWGYRDGLNRQTGELDIPGMEFHTKNFTPTLLPATAFVDVFPGVREARVGSQGFDEDVYSGLKKAMLESQWTEGALRLVVLVGDAPNHPIGFKWNTSGESEQTIRDMADQGRFSLFAIHIWNMDGGLSASQLAETQFRTLSRNRGQAEEAYVKVQSANISEFENATAALLARIGDTVTEALGHGRLAGAGPVAEPPAEPEQPAGTAVVQQTKELAGNMLKAGLVDWIGKRKGVQAPRVSVAYVMDRDLKEPDINAFEVCVLLTKSQLDSMRTVLDELIGAAALGRMSGKTFFESVQATALGGTLTPDDIANARNLAQIPNLIPEFLKDLPYMSMIMSMDNDTWSSYGRDQQQQFIDQLNAKVSNYEAVHNTPERWIRLNENDGPDDYVTVISLDMLP